ncbi:UNVERIFIED_CONTAM: hypothetical protein H355_002435 [Colinus virginianus]|nr:hypothetical protein H355_002435 [Colinus virginianus]
MGSGNKENRPDAPLRTPPKQAGCWQPLATPPKPGAALPAEPWTPTANLKVLIRAASPEIRSRERSRCQEHPAGDGRGRAQATRREKSLGSLCHRFLARYPDYPSAEESYYICLDEAAEELKFERRRIYDIVHVLESLHMVSRLAQNRYIWHGRHSLAKTLQALKKAGEENKYTLLIETIKRREHKDEFDLDGKRSEEALRSIFVFSLGAGTDENVSADTSETAQLAAVPGHQLEGPPQTTKEVKKNLLGSTLEHSVARPEAAPRANTHTAAPPPMSGSTPSSSTLPPSHCSALPVILPQPHSGASDAVYLPPFQAHTVTAHGLGFMPLPCANVTGIKSANPNALHETTAREGDVCTAAADPERWESSSKRCLKRSQALQENNLMIKKHRSNEESLDSAMHQAEHTGYNTTQIFTKPAQDRAVFSHFPLSVPEKECQGVQTNCVMESFQGEKQNRPQTLDQSVASSSDQHERERAPENEDRTKTGMTFAVPAREEEKAPYLRKWSQVEGLKEDQV